MLSWLIPILRRHERAASSDRIRIDDERGKLRQACELLSALALAYENDPDGLDYADAALAVRDMIDKSVAGIDPTALRLLVRGSSEL